jgi:hypothetical protein
MDSAALLDPAAYPALAAACRTENELNRLNIDMEHVATPLEMVAIARQYRHLPERSRKWLRSLRRLDRTVFTRPEAYRRTQLARFVTAYSDPAAPAARKQVLVAFCGDVPRIMVQTAFILQVLPAAHWDVILLRLKDGSTSYFEGLDGVAPDFAGLVDFIRREAGIGRYRRVVALGSSSGGYPAIVAGIRLPAARAVALGGRMPRRLPAEDTEPVQGSGIGLVLVHGAAYKPDVDGAAGLARHFGGTAWPVQGVDSHAILYEVLKRRMLGPFLRAILADDSPAPRGAWPGFRLWQ